MKILPLLRTVAVCLVLLLWKAGCAKKEGPASGAPVTPTRGHGFTPRPPPPTATFVPGLPTPPPDLPG